MSKLYHPYNVIRTYKTRITKETPDLCKGLRTLHNGGGKTVFLSSLFQDVGFSSTRIVYKQMNMEQEENNNA